MLTGVCIFVAASATLIMIQNILTPHKKLRKKARRR